MITWRRGVVATVGQAWSGAVELTVDVDGATLPALAYPDLVGLPVLGDVALLNTTALDLGLGTGGFALVVALPDRLPADQLASDQLPVAAARPAGPPRLVKARYTPHQVSVHSVEELADDPALSDARSLDGMPVVVADLHSAVAAVVAGVRVLRPDARAVYVMTDGAALPLWFSRAVAGLRDAGWLAGCVTVGQAYGGDVEAVTVHSGLLAARYHLGADVVVVSQGPGNVGTGTRWGFSGLAVGEVVNAVAALGGHPIGSLRISDADPRTRHRGISHHSRTAYGRVALAPADVVVPQLPEPLASAVELDLVEIGVRHRVVRVASDELIEALRATPVPLSTMGRGLEEDRAYFLAAAAAGVYAATRLGPR